MDEAERFLDRARTCLVQNTKYSDNPYPQFAPGANVATVKTKKRSTISGGSWRADLGIEYDCIERGCIDAEKALIYQ